MGNCVFCKIIKNELPAYVIYEDSYTIAIIPKEMETFGHTIVLPKKHFINIYDVESEYLHAILDTIQKLSIHYFNVLGSTGINILNANGLSAQQSVNHLHFHVIPRFENDGLNARPNFPGYIADDTNKLHQILKL